MSLLKTLILCLSFILSIHAKADFVSPHFNSTLINHSLKEIRLVGQLSCLVIEKGYDGDQWSTGCKEFDLKKGGIDKAQEKLKSSVGVKVSLNEEGMFRVSEQRVYSSVRGKSSFQFSIVALDENAKVVAYISLLNDEILQLAKKLEYLSFYSVEEISTVFSIQDTNNLSIEEFMGFFPENSISYNSSSISKERKALSYTYSAKAGPARIIKILPFTIFKAGALPEDYRYFVKVSLSLPTKQKLETTVEASTSIGLLSNPIFKTSTKMEDYFISGKYRINAISSFGGEKNKAIERKFSGSIDFTCSQNRALTFKALLIDQTANKFSFRGEGKCYAGAVDLEFNAPIYTGKAMETINVKIDSNSGFANFDKTKLNMKAIGLKPSGEAVSFSFEGHKNKKFPNFPNACLNREEAMNLAEKYKFTFGTQNGLKQSAIDDGTYMYAEKPPFGWPQYSSREDFSSFLNKLAKKQVLVSTQEEMYVFYDQSVTRGCRLEAVVLIRCNKTLEHYIRNLGCSS